jgi:hypothetical protein
MNAARAETTIPPATRESEETEPGLALHDKDSDPRFSLPVAVPVPMDPRSGPSAEAVTFPLSDWHFSQ